LTRVEDWFRLDGTTVVVTGGSCGLGWTCASVLREAGAEILVLDLEAPDQLDAADGIRYRRCDVSDEAEVTAAARDIADAQKLVLVNNVGVGPDERSFSADKAVWQRVLTANLFGTMNCCAAFGMVMRDRGGGVIINIGSIFGVAAVPRSLYESQYNDMTGEFPAYAASKAGIIGLTRNLARQWAEFEIRVNSISPGMFDNKHSATFSDPARRNRIVASVPLGRLGEPLDIAAAVLFLASGASSYMTGVNLVLDGGWTA
jgi:NAD(P)-dependent dehydrogenase (short-subunit alcohol dehydrogenase family)